MQAGSDFNDTTELSTYGFLYGTFPAAPGAFVIATQYNIEVELVGYINTAFILIYFLKLFFLILHFRLPRVWFYVLSFRLL